MKITQFVLFVIVSSSFSQWSSDPGTNLMVSSGTDEVLTPRIALGASGDSYVSWAVESTEGLDMRLQRLDLLGNAMWGQNGVLVREGFSSGMVLQYDLLQTFQGLPFLLSVYGPVPGSSSTLTEYLRMGICSGEKMGFFFQIPPLQPRSLHLQRQHR